MFIFPRAADIISPGGEVRTTALYVATKPRGVAYLIALDIGSVVGKDGTTASTTASRMFPTISVVICKALPATSNKPSHQGNMLSLRYI